MKKKAKTITQNISDVKFGTKVKVFSHVNLYGCTIGSNCKIGAFVEIQKNVKIGNNCKISSHTFICEGVTIEDNVFVGHNVTFINDKYPSSVTKNGKLKTEKDWKIEKIIVKNHAAIGSSATILCGVTIGERSMIGAGSLVTKNVPANTLVFGNPAKVIKKIKIERK